MSCVQRSAPLILTALIIVVSLLLGGVGITAYAAGASLPGDALYPFKTTIEKARINLTDDSVVQAGLYVQFAERRLSEMQSLMDQGRDADIALATGEFANNIQQALGLLQGLSQTDPDRADALKGKILVVLRSYSEILANIPEGSRPVINSAINASELLADNHADSARGGDDGGDDDGGSEMSSTSAPTSTAASPPVVPATETPSSSPTSTAIIIVLSTSTPTNAPVSSPTSSVIEGGDVTCQGFLGAVIVDNLYVPQGATCALDSTRVKGTIKVETGASLTARQITVIGNIQAEGSNYVEVLSGSSVGGSIQIKQGGAARVEDTVVNGDIQFESNNGMLNVARNQVGGNVQIFQNAGGVTVANNVVKGNLQCKENNPAPGGGNNVVQGNKEDQCAGL